MKVFKSFFSGVLNFRQGTMNSASLSQVLQVLRVVCMQDNEKKQKREPKETAEELQDCEMVFADF